MNKLTFALLAAALVTASSTVSAQKFDRGINRSVFVPKGQWLTGGSISYSQYKMDEYKILVLDDVNGSGYTMNFSPFLGYFVKNNMALGARFGYKRTLVKLDIVSLNLGDDLSFDIKDYYNLQHVYYGTAMMRNYINLGESKRFGLFNEVRLTLGGGQGKFVSGKGEELKGTYQDIYEFQLGLSPGVAAFITNEMAIEISVGVVGFNVKRINQTTNQVYEGSYTTSSANFKIDLFSINLGIAFYLPTLNPHVGKMLRGGEKTKKQNAKAAAAASEND